MPRGSCCLQVADFGLAQIVDGWNASRASALGTVTHMASVTSLELFMMARHNAKLSASIKLGMRWEPIARQLPARRRWSKFACVLWVVGKGRGQRWVG